MTPSAPRFSLRVTDDKLLVLFSGWVKDDVLEVLAETVIDQLKQMKIRDILTKEGMLIRLAEAMRHSPNVNDLMLAEGRPAVDGIDGVIEWQGEYFTEGFIIDEKTGAIDYRRHTANPSVNDGDHLATATPPKSGKDGVDVFGKRIATRRPKTPRIRAGANVRVVRGKEVEEYYATAAGRVRHSGGQLVVDELYTVSGNVGLKTGDIEHTGALQVTGDIESGASVKVGGDIEVHGMIEDATVETNGNLIVQGGIIGGEERRITVGGILRAKFLQETEVEAKIGVEVRTGIINSTVRTEGGIAMPRGRLIGGLADALGGLQVGEIGSRGEVATSVIVAVDHQLEERLAPLRQHLDTLRTTLDKIHSDVSPLLEMVERLPAEQRTKIQALWEQVPDLTEKIREIEDQIEELTEKSSARAVRRIDVLDRMYPHTTLQIGDKSIRIQDELIGPMAVTRGARGLLVRRSEAPQEMVRGVAGDLEEPESEDQETLDEETPMEGTPEEGTPEEGSSEAETPTPDENAADTPPPDSKEQAGGGN